MEHVLRQVSLLCRSPQVDLKLGWKTPVIGHAWLVFRRRLHQEIRIYIDLLTRQQTSFNTSVARGLAILVERLDDPARRDRLAALETEVGELRREVAESARAGGPRTGSRPALGRSVHGRSVTGWTSPTI